MRVKQISFSLHFATRQIMARICIDCGWVALMENDFMLHLRCVFKYCYIIIIIGNQFFFF